MTCEWISQEMKMLVIYLDCPAGWDHAEIKAESQGSVFLMHRTTDFLPGADAWVAAAELLLLLWPRGMELRAAFGFTTTLLWCAHCACTRGTSEGSWKSLYLRYWNNSLFFQTLGTRKGWEIGGGSLGGKKKDLRRPWKTKLWAGWDFKSSRSIWTRGFFLSRLVKDSLCAF